MVSGVVTIIDAIHEAKIRLLWQEMEQQFGLKGLKIPTFPHVTLHLAEGYNLLRLKETLTHVAAETSTFTTTTSGLGVFTSEQPILYIPVTRSPELNRLHAHLWEIVHPCAEVSSRYYHPDFWMPHITLSEGAPENHHLPDLINAFATRNFSWHLPIENLAIVTDPGNGQPFIVHEQFELQPVTGESDA